jgi:hypothetical protein
MRPGAGPPAEPASQLTRITAARRPQRIRRNGGKRRAASASARGPRPHSLSRSVSRTQRVARCRKSVEPKSALSQECGASSGLDAAFTAVKSARSSLLITFFRNRGTQTRHRATWKNGRCLRVDAATRNMGKSNADSCSNLAWEQNLGVGRQPALVRKRLEASIRDRQETRRIAGRGRMLLRRSQENLTASPRFLVATYCQTSARSTATARQITQSPASEPSTSGEWSRR